VPVDWDESKVVDGKLGDYVTIARRQGKDWYLGAITDENAREMKLDLSFLDPNQNYQVVVYGDAADSHFDTNPTAYDIETSTLEAGQGRTLDVRLAPGGGAAIQLKAI